MLAHSMPVLHSPQVTNGTDWMVSPMPGTPRTPIHMGTSLATEGLDPVPVPAGQPDEEGQKIGMSAEWPLQSRLELFASPSAVPIARSHTRQVLQEWGRRELAEATELVVSEIVTNAVRASGGIDEPQGQATTRRLPAIRMWLNANRQGILVQVWDGNRRMPQRQQPSLEAERGRGLLLVDALCETWGSFAPDGWRGKVVWGIIGNAPARSNPGD
jgi:anti-sigma regulatory factor (Ser/Thr protein kinase)